MYNNNEIIAKALERAIMDCDFKNLLLSDYKSAVRTLQVGSLNYSNGERLKFVDQYSPLYSKNIMKGTNKEIIISIPENSDILRELSDEELEKISAGWKDPFGPLIDRIIDMIGR